MYPKRRVVDDNFSYFVLPIATVVDAQFIIISLSD